MKITTTILREPFDHKPIEVIGTIVNKCVDAETIELKELCDLIALGCTFKSCDCGKNATDFHSGMLFTLDFDNKEESKRITPSEAISLAVKTGYKPSVMYRSFSSTEVLPKFRLIFVADRPLTDRKQWEHCQSVISAIYPKGVTDHTDNPNRCFFGTDKGIDFIDETATVSVDALLSGYTEPQIRISTTASNSDEIIYADESIIDAIKRHDAEYIRTALHRDKYIEFDNRDDFYRYVYQSIDLASVLGVPPRKKFVCVFGRINEDSHQHGDTESPSASVFKAFSGVWMYSCKAEGFTISIKPLIEKIGGFKSEYKVWEFIKSAFNIGIKETAWSIEQKSNLDSIINTLSRNDETGFASLCPTANYNLRFCKPLLVKILTLAKDCIMPDQVDGENIVFFMPTSRLKDHEKQNETAIKEWVRVLCYHEILKNVPVDQVPEPLRKKAQIYKAKLNHEHFPNFYTVPSWVFDQLANIERQGIEYKKRGYRRKSFTYEGMLRSEGKETALRLFPEYAYCKDKATGEVAQRGTTKTSDRHQEIIMEVMTDAIAEKGYTTEAEVIDRASIRLKADAQRMNRKPKNNVSGRYTAQKQLFRSINDIMDANNLKKVRCNKALKEQYGIKGNGYPVIITIQE